MVNNRQNRPAPVDPLGQLADPAEVFRNPPQVEFIRTMLRFIRDALVRTVFTDQAAPQIILISPGGKSYRVTVDDNGALKTDLIRG